MIQLMDMFPTEQAATEWFEAVLWNGERCCVKCGGTRTTEASHKYMPYWCTDCRSYFSIRTETPMANSKVPLRKWAIAIYLCLTSLKSVASMKLSRDIGVSQPTAWFMLHRIREAWAQEPKDRFSGPCEVDESFLGGRRRNMRNARRKALADTGRGAVGKTAVVGLKDRASNQVRAKVVERTDAETLQGFVRSNTEKDAIVYTDDALAYEGVSSRHESVRHSVGEYVRAMAHTNGIESFWSMLKRAHKGTFHKISPKHLDRYVQEFAGKHNIRESGTLAQCATPLLGLSGATFSTATLLPTTGFPRRRGRSGRNRARASFSGVAPTKSLLGSSIGFMYGSLPPRSPAHHARDCARQPQPHLLKPFPVLAERPAHAKAGQ